MLHQVCMSMQKCSWGYAICTVKVTGSPVAQQRPCSGILILACRLVKPLTFWITEHEDVVHVVPSVAPTYHQLQDFA